jgi:hypothetical protein
MRFRLCRDKFSMGNKLPILQFCVVRDGLREVSRASRVSRRGRPVCLPRATTRGRPYERRSSNSQLSIYARGIVDSQCLKCRLPVKTMAIPRLSAAAMTSSSFFEPPG